jgi:hypothetical protein
MRSTDEKLNLTIAQTLDRSLDDLGNDTDIRLQQVRQLALMHTIKKRHTTYIAIGSIAAALILSWVLISPPPSKDTTALALNSNDYMQEEPLMLANWEMLMTIGETPDV